MRLLIDTNILLDMVLKRKNCDISMELFRKIRTYKAEAYITASSVTDLFYIIRKEMHSTEQAYVIMENILKLTAILSVTENDVQEAFAFKWKDFEDCVQYVTGKNNHINYIVTANQKDYKNATLPVLTPAACIELINLRAN